MNKGMSQKKTKTNDYWVDLDRKYRMQANPSKSIVLERGRGVNVWDVEGNKYLDFESGQMTMLVGHSHPLVLQSIKKQIEFIMQTGMRLLNVPRIFLAKKLAEITPDPFQQSYFASTGSECVEAAVRLAKKYTGCFEIVAILGGYHGRTLGSDSYTSCYPKARLGYGPGVSGAAFIPAPYCYRCPFNESLPCNLSCLAYTEEVIDRETSGEPAALLMEFMLSAGGVIIPPRQWVKRIQEICKERRMLIIADEAGTGLGRTGKWFAFQHFDVVPDILVLAKGLGEGVPLGAVMTSEHIGTEAVRKGHSQAASHMGDPFQCAVGLANLQVIEREKLLDNGATQGAYLKKGLEDLSARCEVLGDVRGVGLFIGMEIVESRESKKRAPEMAKKINVECVKRGLLLGLREGSNIFRLCPPLVITEEEVTRALTIIEEALAGVAGLSKR